MVGLHLEERGELENDKKESRIALGRIPLLHATQRGIVRLLLWASRQTRGGPHAIGRAQVCQSGYTRN